MSTMHIPNGWAELGITDHSDDFAAPPATTLTDFKHVCLCHQITIDGVEFMAYNPNCEQPGHGCRSRYIALKGMDSTNCREVGEIHSGRRSLER